MTIPLWLPWVILLALLAAALPKPDSPLRTWGPAAVALVVAVWLTVAHLWVTQADLAEATTDAAAVVDGSIGGVTQDRIRIEIEDRLGRPVTVERESADASSGEDAPSGEHAEISYNYIIRTAGDRADAGGTVTCVHAVEHRVDSSASAASRATVTTENGECQ